MADLNLGERAAMTLTLHSKVIYDNITNDNALLMRLEKKGGILSDDSGGTNHSEDLMYAENENYKWYQGQESFIVNDTQAIDSAQFERKYLGTFLPFSGKDRIENRGKHRVHNLLKARTKVAVQTLKNQVATSLYSDGTDSKAIAGLRFLVDDDPTSAGTVGGIDQAASTGVFWRNQYTPSTSVTASTVRGLMNAQWLTQIRGADHPDLILGDSHMYTAYEESLQENIRYTNSKMADAGFEAIKYKRADFVYDDQCPTKRMYMLNTDYLFLKCPSERKFKVGDARLVTNADYEVVPIFFAGAMTCANRSLQGVIIAS